MYRSRTVVGDSAGAINRLFVAMVKSRCPRNALARASVVVPPLIMIEELSSTSEAAIAAIASFSFSWTVNRTSMVRSGRELDEGLTAPP